ncbi:MAG: beta-lactamase family protein [Propionibacteriaceae bacterium]|nr:beta-lactamase family protein [Propionibacteriaceae bacterium]
MGRLLTILALALCLGALGLVSIPAQASGDPLEDTVDAELPASGVPGLAWAVVAHGEVASVGTRGVVRMGSAERVAPDTPFVIGSISKSFTALAVMQLVEAGRIDLDTAVSHYLDRFSAQPAGTATIRQLLTHTSGYSTLQGNASHTDVGGGPDELARRVDRLSGEALAHPPGEAWEYSNANYLVLGRLIEVVSGQDYQAYVTAHILEPLGMRHSFVSDGQVHLAMATGHTPWFGTRRPLADNATSRGMAPAGGVVASAADLARYLQVMMNGTDDVLSADGKAAMMRPAGGTSPFYGFGWFVDAGRGTVWHSGSTPGFESLATMLPDEREAVVVLVNGGSGIGFGETSRLRNGITAMALGLDDQGEGSRWPQQALFVSLVLLPIGYLLSMAWAWRHRAALRAK